MMKHYLQAKISKSALIHNCNLLRELAGGIKLCVAIKANAYGHGVKQCLEAFDEANVNILAVACIEEAVELRCAKWEKPILILGSEFSIYRDKQQQEIAELIVKNDFRITATQKKDIDVISLQAKRLQKKAYIHLMYDSGMSRMGLGEKEFFELFDYIKRKPEIEIEGLYTHLATADSSDKSFAIAQLNDFKRIIAKIKTTANSKIPIIHAANSGATIDIPESRFDMIRPGISIYGYHSSQQMHNKPQLKPALKLISYLTITKRIPKNSYIGYGCTYKAKQDMIIGIVPIGYADGYFRELSNSGKMIIAQQVVPVIGRVSMDQTIVDLTEAIEHNQSISAGSEITIIDNSRTSPNSVENLALLLNTIPNVIVTALNKRIKRIKSR